MVEREELDPLVPPCLHLVSAFLAMEPVDSLVAMARECGGGSLSERVQQFIWDHCMRKAAEGKFHAPYFKKFLKKIITEIESSHGDVLDVLYEQYTHYMVSLKDENLVKGIGSVCKSISFIFPDGSFELSSCPESRKLVVPLQCSLNMLEGDTGCSLWPSCLFLSELILSFPEIFSKKMCFEVGSGVGLVGICLAHVKASEVVLTDGDLTTLENMRVNLDLNHLTASEKPRRSNVEPEMKLQVECIHMPWESTSESELQYFTPDIVLGADVIYDPICLPHLVRVFGILLKPRKALLHHKQINNFNGTGRNDHDACQVKTCYNDVPDQLSNCNRGPVAYIASVIRNIETFNRFLALIEEANLAITDATNILKPIKLLSYMHSYSQSNIRLFIIRHRL